MSYKVGVIRGDGIGPEIVAEALKVLDKVAEKYNEKFDYTDILLGGASIDATGKPLTEEALETAKSCDAVLWVPLVAIQQLLHGISFRRT